MQTCHFQQIADGKIANLKKVVKAIPLPSPHGLENWHHGVIILSWVRLGHYFTLAFCIRKLASWRGLVGVMVSRVSCIEKMLICRL